MDEIEVPVEYRVSGILMIVSGVLNLLAASIYVLALIWVCVGVVYLVPLFIALAEIGVGVMTVAGARVPGVQVLSTLGAVSGMLMCNPWTMLLEAIAVVLQLQPRVRYYLEG